MLFNDFFYLLPEFILSLGFFFLLLLGLSKRFNYQYINKYIIFLLIIVWILQLYMPNLQTTFCLGAFYYDEGIKYIKLIILLITILYFIVSTPYFINQKLISHEISIIILIATFGLMLLTMSYSFLTLYITLEIVSLSFYILAITQRNSYFSNEASLKYFILGAIASGFILLGMSYIYSIFGSLNFGQITILLINTSFDITINKLTCLTSISFILVGLFFKLGVAPFHAWLPDVYEGTPTNITLFFATAPKLVFLSILYRLFFDLFYQNLAFHFSEFFLFFALFSIIIGTFSAIKQKKIKRLLAFSSINHMGFILINFAFNDLDSITVIIYYSLIYILMSIIFWTILISLYIDNKPIKYITDLTGIFQQNKLWGFIISFNILSMAGIPPFAGFFIKYAVFINLITHHSYLISIIIVICSVISSVYYLRIIKTIFFDEKPKKIIKIKSKINSILIIFFSLILIIFLFLTNSIYQEIYWLMVKIFISIH